MLNIIIYAMVFLGSALMVYNIIGFILYARSIKSRKNWDGNNSILHIPIVLLIFFLLGYLFVGIFGDPDIVMSGILFFGSVFVFIMYRLLTKITKKVIEQEELEVKARTAEESDRIKTRFLASISHEMRTPMNVIIGTDEVALKNPDLMPETREQLERIGLSAKYLLGVVNNILELNSLESGELEVREEEFALSSVIGQINVLSSAKCKKKGLDYEVKLKNISERKFVGDETLIRQVIMNILNNAAEYTDPPGRVDFSAEIVSEDAEGAVLRASVKDTGIGIDSEFLNVIFDPFSREDESSTTRFRGTGLSLAVSKKILDQMGGEIAIKSRKGEGTLCTVSIPLKYAEEKAVSDEPESEETLEGRMILVVDDIADNAEIAADLLELEGAESEIAENGLEAVNMFEQSSEHYYDAVLMDLRMPVMDGLEAARRIRALDRKDAKTVPIIALTANAFEDDINDSLDAGMDAHLAKPAGSEELYATLKELIKKSLNIMSNA